MTQNYVIDQVSRLLIEDLKKENCDVEQACRQYVQMALSIGIDHFYSDMEEVIAFDKKGNEVGRYKSSQEAAAKLGCDRRDVSRVIEGKRHSCGGYIFMKLKDHELMPVKKTA